MDALEYNGLMSSKEDTDKIDGNAGLTPVVTPPSNLAEQM